MEGGLPWGLLPPGCLGSARTLPFRSRALAVGTVWPAGVGWALLGGLYSVSLFPATLPCPAAQAPDLHGAHPAGQLSPSPRQPLPYLPTCFSISAFIHLSNSQSTRGPLSFSWPLGLFLYYDLNRGFRRETQPSILSWFYFHMYLVFPLFADQC